MNLLHAFAQDEFADFDTPTPGYNLLNAELGYTTKLERQAGLVPEMTIGIKGENLLNDDIRNSVSFKKDEVLQPGAQRAALRHRQAQLTTATCLPCWRCTNAQRPAARRPSQHLRGLRVCGTAQYAAWGEPAGRAACCHTGGALFAG